MDRDETIGQRRYFSSAGTAPVICDRCGLPSEHARTVVVEGRSGLAEPIEGVTLCPDCQALIDRGLEPVELAGEE
ncbi:MAG TPA: hypothetical protein VMM78_02605 [Thermomicrobiales bacterium]|nr:hypothetical protein [Thermomicrobiales bacterium]